MIIKVRGEDYTALPFPYKKFVDLEEKGLIMEDIMQKKKDCPACQGTKKVDSKKCKTCDGSGKVIAISKKEVYVLLETILLHVGVPQDTIDALTMEEVGKLLPVIVNFMSAKESPVQGSA